MNYQEFWTIISGVLASVLIFFLGYYTAYASAIENCNSYYADCQSKPFLGMNEEKLEIPGHEYISDRNEGLNIHCEVYNESV